jgi:hypothetical protein
MLVEVAEEYQRFRLIQRWAKRGKAFRTARGGLCQVATDDHEQVLVQ